MQILPLLISLLMLTSNSFAADSNHAKAPHLEVEFISDHRSVAPGESFKVGFNFKLDSGWHIYWKNPGDSGEPPKMNWALSPHLKASDIQWPIPQRIPVGPLVNYGYENQILLPVTMQADSGLSAADTNLSVELKWLVCREECIPGKAQLKLPLSFASHGEMNPSTSVLFEATEKNIAVSQPANWQLHGALEKDNFKLKIDGVDSKVSSALFFPSQTGLTSTTAPVVLNASGNSLTMTIQRSDQLIDQYTKDLKSIDGVLVLSNGAESIGYNVNFSLGGMSDFDSSKLFFALLFAFLGGLLLNLMPCVFPVLSIKVMSIAKMSGASRKEIVGQGWAYTIGILVSFWLLVGTLVLLRLGGSQIGWGFQLQSPKFVIVLACLLFAFGLNLLGLFEFSGGFTGWGSSLTRRDGYAGSFFTGALAVLVATPCTAPFMGSAVGYALTQPSWIVFAIFTMLAMGLALPYLIISYVPSIGRILPRPGRWMETFKECMAFLIFATVIWLAWVLSIQASSLGLFILICTFFVIGFSTWIHRRFPGATIFAVLLALASVVAAAKVISTESAMVQATTATGKDGLAWEAYSPEKVEAYQKSGRSVFVDFTAAWCVSCKVNELMVFRSDEVIQKLKEKNVALLKADWTNQDPIITKTLASYGRSGVPFYLIYGKEKDQPATPLPEVITAGLVLKELEKLK